MFLSSVRQALAALFVAVLVTACGGSGDPAPAPTGGIAVSPGDGKATVTWQMDPNVKYWVFYAPTTSAITTANWTNFPGSVAAMNVSSPYVVTGLVNGFTYGFTVNGRTGDAAGGPGSPSVSIIPRPAGATWSAPQVLGSNTLRGITYGLSTADSLGYYLAAGDNGSAFKSRDGLTFTAAASVPNTNVNAVIYNLSKYMAVGASGIIYTSTDLNSWTPANAATGQNLNAIASNGTIAIVVGNNGTVRSTADGIVWTGVTVPTTQNLYGITYTAAGYWVAVGAGGTVLTSADGVTWTAAASGTTADLRAVAVQAYTTYTYVAVGDSGTILRSTDNGATWTAQASPTQSNLLAVSAASTQFLVTGSSGTIATSVDGITWTSRASGTTTDLYAVISGLAQYVAVGSGGVTINSQ